MVYLFLYLFSVRSHIFTPLRVALNDLSRYPLIGSAEHELLILFAYKVKTTECVNNQCCSNSFASPRDENIRNSSSPTLSCDGVTQLCGQHFWWYSPIFAKRKMVRNSDQHFVGDSRTHTILITAKNNSYDFIIELINGTQVSVPQCVLVL